MRHWQIFRDIVVVCSCLYVVWVISDARKPHPIDNGKFITDLYNRLGN